MDEQHNRRLTTAAHVFVADLEHPVLDPQDREHLRRSLRLRPGEEVGASDGRGGWRACRWDAGGELRPVGGVVRVTPASPPLTMALAAVKGERSDWAVQKLTELGVARIVPLRTARSVVRWEGEQIRRGVERWRRVARAAAMQSRRVWLPEVSEVTGFADLVAAARTLGGVALATPGGGPPSLARPTVLVGPEGGWSREELEAGLPTVGLGSEVLRTETAAVVAASLLGALRAGLVAPAPGDEAPSGAVAPGGAGPVGAGPGGGGRA